MTPFEAQEIRDAGRGHLIPDYDLYDIYGGPEEDDDDRDAVDAREEAENGADERQHGDWRDAMGVLKGVGSDEPAEDIIRRLRGRGGDV